MAIGQTSGPGTNYISRVNNLPNHDSATVCGYYYHGATPPAGGSGISSVSNNTSTRHVMYVDASNVVAMYNNNFINNIATISAGNWYFWAYTFSGTTCSAYFTPIGVPLSGNKGTMSRTAGYTTTRVYGLQDDSGGGSGVGYVAHMRAWSSVLTVSELNAERLSRTAVKGGVLFDAPLPDTASLDGFNLSGSLVQMTPPDLGDTNLYNSIWDNNTSWGGPQNSTTLNSITQNTSAVNSFGPRTFILMVALDSQTSVSQINSSATYGPPLVWTEATGVAGTTPTRSAHIWWAHASSSCYGLNVAVTMSDAGNFGFKMVSLKGAKAGNPIGVKQVGNGTAAAATSSITLSGLSTGSMLFASYWQLTASNNTTSPNTPGTVVIEQQNNLPGFLRSNGPVDGGTFSLQTYNVGSPGDNQLGAYAACEVLADPTGDGVVAAEGPWGVAVGSTTTNTISSSITTTGPRLLVAYHAFSGGGTDHPKVTGMAGSGITWRPAMSASWSTSNQLGTEIWYAVVTGALTAANVTSTLNIANNYAFMVEAYRNHRIISPVGKTLYPQNPNGGSWQFSGSLTGTATGSLLALAGWAVNDVYASAASGTALLEWQNQAGFFARNSTASIGGNVMLSAALPPSATGLGIVYTAAEFLAASQPLTPGEPYFLTSSFSNAAADPPNMTASAPEPGLWVFFNVAQSSMATSVTSPNLNWLWAIDQGQGKMFVAQSTGSITNEIVTTTGTSGMGYNAHALYFIPKGTLSLYNFAVSNYISGDIIAQSSGSKFLWGVSTAYPDTTGTANAGNVLDISGTDGGGSGWYFFGHTTGTSTVSGTTVSTGLQGVPSGGSRAILIAEINVLPPTGTSGIRVDTEKIIQSSGVGTSVGSVKTSSPNELVIVTFPHSVGTVDTVTGTGGTTPLAFTKVTGAFWNSRWDVGIWAAWAASTGTYILQAEFASYGSDEFYTISALTGVKDGSSNVMNCFGQMSSSKQDGSYTLAAASATLTGLSASSYVFAAFSDWNASTERALIPNTTYRIAAATTDGEDGAGDCYMMYRSPGPVGTSTYTIGSTYPTDTLWGGVAVEVLAGAEASPPADDTTGKVWIYFLNPGSDAYRFQQPAGSKNSAILWMTYDGQPRGPTSSQAEFALLSNFPVTSTVGPLDAAALTRLTSVPSTLGHSDVLYVALLQYTRAGATTTMNPATPTGLGLTWIPVISGSLNSSNSGYPGSEATQFWTALATTGAAAGDLTATFQANDKVMGDTVVWAWTGAEIGQVVASGNDATGYLTSTLTGTTSGSTLLWGAACGGTRTTFAINSNSTVMHMIDADAPDAGIGNTYAYGYASSSGENISFGVSSSVNLQYWEQAAIEVMPTRLTPSMGIGQYTTNSSSYLYRTTQLPTYNDMTICGFFYYWDTPTGDETIVSVAYNAGGGHTWFGVNSSNQAQGWDNSGGYTATIRTLAKGNWYFWTLWIDGTTATYSIIPAASTFTGGMQNLTVPAAQTTSAVHSLQSNTISSPATGYVARIRAWSGQLTDAEIDAERRSATAVKAGSLFDAKLSNMGELGGFTVSGTLLAGPGARISNLPDYGNPPTGFIDTNGIAVVALDINLTRVYVSSSTRVLAMSAYAENLAGPGTIQQGLYGVIYNDNAGEPGTLNTRADVKINEFIGPTWYHSSWNDGPVLTPGYYWIGFHAGDTDWGVYSSAGPVNANRYLGPQTWPTPDDMTGVTMNVSSFDKPYYLTGISANGVLSMSLLATASANPGTIALTSSLFTMSQPVATLYAVIAMGGYTYCADYTVAWSGSTPAGATGWTRILTASLEGTYPGQEYAAIWRAETTRSLSNVRVYSTNSSGAAVAGAGVLALYGFYNSSGTGSFYVREGNDSAAVVSATLTSQAANSYIIGAWGDGITTGPYTYLTGTVADITASDLGGSNSKADVGHFADKTTSAGQVVSIGASDSKQYSITALALEIKSA